MRKMTLPMIALSAVIAFSAKNSAALSAADLRLKNTNVPGWTEDADAFIAFDRNSLTEIVAHADESRHLSNGLVNGITQIFWSDGADGVHSCRLFAEDFGTSANARKMVNATRSAMTLTVTMPGYDGATTIGKDFDGGCLFVAAFDRFYFEVSVSGYAPGASVDSARHDAEVFLHAYRSKIEASPIRGFTPKKTRNHGHGQVERPARDALGRRMPPDRIDDISQVLPGRAIRFQPAMLR